MAGVDVGGGGKGGRKSLDSEINMIPFIDLLMVTIAFLLITAVWTHMARLNADAQVPGPPSQAPIEDQPKDKTLHIKMASPEKFELVWKQGATVVSTVDVPRKDEIAIEGKTKVIRYRELAEKVEAEWKTVGQHRDATDKKFDQAVLHTDNETPYAAIIGVMDAVYKVKREVNTGKKNEKVPAFNMTFSVN